MKVSKISYFILTLCVSINLTGCDKAIKAEEERLAKLRIAQEKDIDKKTAEEKKTHFEKEIGTYDGCKVTLHTVHWFPGGAVAHRFYIAKCKDEKDITTTTTEVTSEKKMIGKYTKYEEKLTATIKKDDES